MLRVALLLMGLVFLISLLVAALVLLVIWLMRALWAALTGRPLAPLSFTIIRQANWGRFYRPGQAPPRADDADVIDVPSRQIDSDRTLPQDKREP